jgi:hypothetical protein
MLRRLLRLGLAIAIALIVGVPGCVVWHSRDLPEVLDGDLAIPPLLIEDEESNAYTHWERAAVALVWPEDTEGSLDPPHLGDNWNPQRAEQLVASNEVALAHLLRALEAPSFQVPRYDILDLDPVPVSLAVPSLQLAHVLAARALLSAERGETRAALEEALTAVHFGHRLQQAHRSNLFLMMTGAALKGRGLRIMREIAAHAPIDAALAREFATRLDGYRTEPETWSRMWAWEYQAHKTTWELVRDPQTRQLKSYEVAYLAERESDSWLISLIPGAYVYHHNRSLTLEAEFTRSMQRDSFKPCAELEPPTEFVPEDGFERLRMILSPNSVGKIVLAISTPNLRDFQLRRCGSETALAATRAVLVLEAYRRERGKLPGSLEDLVPELLPEVPRDGFDGAPLRYLAERAVVYSVGADLVDEGGRVGADERDVDEPAFWLGDPARAVGEGEAG